jgi:hypothetical protein
VSPYNSSNQNFYAIVLQLIEIPMKIRYTYINQIILFLIKYKNININEIFLNSSFIDNLNEIYKKGFKFKKYIIRLRIICFTSDLPARALLFNQGF